jgi:hypothetical protein
MGKIGSGVVGVAAVAAAALLTGCASAPPAAAPPSAPAVASSAEPATAATAPAASECSSFAQVYNDDVGPMLSTRAPGDNVDIYFTKLSDAFNALAATTSSADDPYSQTITKDAEAVAAAPSSYSAVGTFNTDLTAFLTQCGMSPGT